MADDAGGVELPIFTAQDQALFDIKDNKKRASLLQEVLLPKLHVLLDLACNEIRNVYKIDPFENSSVVHRPAPRKDTKSPVRYPDAYLGLGLIRDKEDLTYKKPDGTPAKFGYFHLRFQVIPEEGMCPILQVSRPTDAEIFFSILRKNEAELLSMLGSTGLGIACDQEFSDEAGVSNVIREARPSHDDQWWLASLCGPFRRFPIEDKDLLSGIIMEFTDLFMVYQSLVEAALGREDRFSNRYESWRRHFSDALSDKPEDEEPEPVEEGSARLEGTVHERVHRDRARDRSLRQAKLEQSKKQNQGRLVCEVPRCGFDFLECYGEIGNGFAHVHHIHPLGKRDETGAETSLDDLKIVCANCHAMIHRTQEPFPWDEIARLITKHRSS